MENVEYTNSDPGSEYRTFYGSVRTPKGATPIPTKEDYKNGVVQRYFIKNINEEDSIPFEISREEYESWRNPEGGINQNNWSAISIKWKISGPKEVVLNSLGYPERQGVRPTNLKLIKLYTASKLNSKDKSLKHLDKVLTDPLQYWDGRNSRKQQ